MYCWNTFTGTDNKNVGKNKDFMQTNKNVLKHLIHTSHGNYEFRKTDTSFKPVK